MPDSSRTVEAVQPDPDVVDLDRYASYEDGDGLVVCDRENPNAWLRSDAVTDLET